jgi:hypothetical protein
MSDTLTKILNSIGLTLGTLSFALFLAAEIHAWGVVTPKGILCENPDFGVMWHMDSMVPMQFRLMSYRAGGGEFRNLGFLLPSAALFVLGLTLLVGTGMNYLERALERRKRRYRAPKNSC